ncbi:MAG TPA: hypothetical protein VJM50_24735 [Pyrinomonadaceae bacterium]|nr:hypothetical protein [Pyrinomonadaceae bacterium]
MESKWALNAYRYGLIGFLDFAAQTFGHRPTLYAHLDTEDVLISNVVIGVSTTAIVALPITGDDRVDFTIIGRSNVGRPPHFPFGYGVEPDLPP